MGSSDPARSHSLLCFGFIFRRKLEPGHPTNTTGAAEKGGGKVSISLTPFPPAAGPLSSEIR